MVLNKWHKCYIVKCMCSCLKHVLCVIAINNPLPLIIHKKALSIDKTVSMSSLLLVFFFKLQFIQEQCIL